MSWRARISRHVQEFRFVACDTSEHSKGLRKFIDNNHRYLEMLNPNTPLVYREADQMDPFVYARFDWGQEEKVMVHNKSEEEIMEVMKGLVETGVQMAKSPESDVILAQPIISADDDEEEVEGINVTWDGVTVRQNPYSPIL